MSKLAPLCIAAILAIHVPGGAVRASPAPAAEQAAAAQIDALLAPHYKAGGPGAVVLVTKNGQSVLRKAYGAADVSAKLAMQVGHRKSRLGCNPASAISMTQPYAAGAIVSTVDDLARWNEAIVAGKLLTPASWAKAHASYKLPDGKPTHYGYGWNVSTLRGSPLLDDKGAVGKMVLVDEDKEIVNESVGAAR